MRTITRSEFVNGAGEGVYVSTVHYASAAERDAGDAACQRVVVAAAFVPADGLAGIVGKGRPFDPREGGQATYNGPPQVFMNDPAEEPWPSDGAAKFFGEAQPGQEPTQSGQMLAHAMHDAAEGPGEGCTTAGCVVPQVTDEA